MVLVLGSLLPSLTSLERTIWNSSVFIVQTRNGCGSGSSNSFWKSIGLMASVEGCERRTSWRSQILTDNFPLNVRWQMTMNFSLTILEQISIIKCIRNQSKNEKKWKYRAQRIGWTTEMEPTRAVSCFCTRQILNKANHFMFDPECKKLFLNFTTDLMSPFESLVSSNPWLKCLSSRKGWLNWLTVGTNSHNFAPVFKQWTAKEGELFKL